MTEITPQDLKTRLNGPGAPLLLDVRQDWETKLCRLPNAVHIPIEEIELRTDELNPEDEIVVYCHQGVRSAAVANFLRGLGFKSVTNLAGGLDAWARTVDPGMRRHGSRRLSPSAARAASPGARSNGRRSIFSSPRSSMRCVRPSRTSPLIPPFGSPCSPARRAPSRPAWTCASSASSTCRGPRP